MKRIFKKLLSVVLVVAMFLCSSPLVGFVGLELSDISALFELKAMATDTSYTEGYYTYIVDENGEATITNVNTSISGNITIPSTLGGYSLTSIGDDAFYDCDSLTIITIPDSVISVGSCAFCNCDSLTSVTIPDSVTCIDNLAFGNCSNLASVIIGNSVTIINYRVFFNCTSLTSVIIGKSVTSIDNSAFEQCTSLEDITIPDSVRSIGDSAFENCQSLESISIGNGVTRIDNYAFYNTKYYNNTNNWVNDVLYIGNYLIVAKDSISDSYNVKDGTFAIADYAFSDCDNLESVILPNSVKSIGDYSFSYCENLASITIPEYCENLASITIPDGVTYIGDSAFYNCKNLASITIPDGVTYIGDSAFFNCENLASITLPDSVIDIGNRAFYGCLKLSEITFGKNLTSIGEAAFCMAGLTSIFIPESVVSIGREAFEATILLTEITVDIDNKYYSSDEYGVLFDKNKSKLIQYPARSIRSNYVIPNSVSSIEVCAFFGSPLEKIIIPDSVTTIGDGAFIFCNNLEYVHIPLGVTKLYSEDYGAYEIISSNTYICSETIDCHAKEYADALGYTFVLCNGHNIEEHTHSYASSITKEASCTETGIMTYTCECGDNYAEEIEKIAHTEGDWEIVSEATCTTQGRKTKKCTVCGEITQNETIPFADHPDKNSDGLCDICDKISNEDLVKNIHVSIATPETRTIKYMESIKLYATATNLPDGYQIKWKVEGDGVSIKPSSNGKTCTVTSTSSGNVVIKAYVVDSNGKIVTDENGKQISDSEYFYSDANLWLRIVYFFKKLFGISMTTAQLFMGKI